MTTKETKIIISGESSKYERTMRDVRRVNKKTTDAMREQWKITGNIMKGVAVAFAAVFVYNMKKSIDAASDLQETASKFSVVFAGQTELAEKWSKGLVEGYAMSTREAKFYLSSVQDLLVPMGMQAEAAGNLSNEIVKLSADLGSFNNLPTAKVMLDIQSALVGNFETMKKYGVVLNATVVQEKALAMGLARTKDGLTAGMRAQAAYSLMVEGSRAAIGDMERTSDSYANQVKKLQGNLEDLRALIGTSLLPEITKIVSNINKWVKENEDLLKQKVPEYIDKTKDAAGEILEIIQKNPDIIEFGVIGMALFGRKGAIVLGGMARLGNVVGLQARAIRALNKGQITFMQFATSNFQELKALLDKIEKTSENIRYKIPPSPNVAIDQALLAAFDLSGTSTGGAGGPVAATGTTDDALASFYRDVDAEDARLERLAEYNIKLGELQWERRNAEIVAEVEHSARIGEIESERIQNRLILEQELSDKIVKMQIQANMAKINLMKSVGIAALQIAGVDGEKMFVIQKGLQVGLAVMAALTASALARANPPGPPWTEPLAQLTLKVGLMNAAAIGAVAIGQMAASGGGSAGGGTYTSPTITAPATSTITDVSPETRGTLTVNIEGDFIGDEGYIEMLAEKLSEAVGDRDVTLYASDSRFAEALS